MWMRALKTPMYMTGMKDGAVMTLHTGMNVTVEEPAHLKKKMAMENIPAEQPAAVKVQFVMSVSSHMEMRILKIMWANESDAM